jgi:porin
VLGFDTVNKIAPLLPYEHSGHNLMAYYNFDQYIYHEKDDPTQGVGAFGRFGWAEQEVNAVAHFYDVGVSGKGVISGRDHDTFGVGYYYLDLSHRLPSIFHSEQGIEAYYNIEITPWLHITPDLQIIVNPGGADMKDTSVVYGIRAQISL